MTNRIKLVTHPLPWQTWQARRDYAIVTGQETAERPWWLEDMISGVLFYDIFGCVGWPEEVKESIVGKPGYAAIVGIIRPSDTLNPIPARDAQFLILEEIESDDVPTLIKRMSEMRERWGYGVKPGLLESWFGDPERFQTTMALCNERLGEAKAVMVHPAEDSGQSISFDLFVRSIRSCIQKGAQRLFMGPQKIIAERLKEFYRNDPAILALGGLVHSLLMQCLWMDGVSGNGAFNVEERV